MKNISAARLFCATKPAIAAVAVILCGIAGASAADLGRMPVKAPPAPYVVPVYNWNGFYIGGHVGWGRTESSWSETFTGLSGDNSENGFLGGGQIGYNWQFNNILLGIEGQISATDLSASRTFGPNVIGDTMTASADLNWIASLTGRLGFTANNWLFYMKGGGAWADVDANATVNIVGSGTFTGARSDTRSGWTIGGGAEWGFAPNWSALLEYQFYDFGDRSFTPALAPAGTNLTVESDIHTVKLGVNYRFGPWR